jgi:S1-C subfamily serine protease
VLISSVVPQSPADKAGMKAGDILLRLDGSPITVRFQEELPPFFQRLSDIPAGKEAEVAVLRDAKERRFTVRTVEMEKAAGDEREFKAWGLTLRELTAPAARNLRLTDKNGVYVTGVRRGGPAGEAEPSLSRGDIIRAVDGAPITDLKQFRGLYEKAVKEKRKDLLVELERNGPRLLAVVKPVFDEAAQDEDQGFHIRKAWAPCETQVLTSPLAQALNLEGKRGVRVTRVFEELGAAEAGLRVGDVITAVDGVGVPASRDADGGVFQTMIRRKSPGRKADFTVIRGGKEMHIAVTLPKEPISSEEAKRYKDAPFEITVRDVVFWDRVYNRWDKDQAGVIVEQAIEGGWAALGGLRSGDFIQKIGQSSVENVKSFQDVMRRIAEAKPNQVVFFVLRGVDTRYLVVEPNWDEIR